MTRETQTPETQTQDTTQNTLTQIPATKELLAKIFELWDTYSLEVEAEEPLPVLWVDYKGRIEEADETEDDEIMIEKIRDAVQELIGIDDYFKVVILGVDAEGDPYIILI